MPSYPKRAADRRKALVDELAHEQAALATAQKALAQQEAIRLRDERNYAGADLRWLLPIEVRW